MQNNIPPFLKLKWPKDVPAGTSTIFKSDCDFVFTKTPSPSDLEDFILHFMNNNGRILRFHGEDPEALKVIADLAIDYRPWQFRWTSQQDGSFSADWTCIDEWIAEGKYKREF